MNRNVRTYNSVGVAMTSRVARSRPYVLSDIFVITFPYLIRRLTKLSSSYTVFLFSSPTLSLSLPRSLDTFLNTSSTKSILNYENTGISIVALDAATITFTFVTVAVVRCSVLCYVGLSPSFPDPSILPSTHLSCSCLRLVGVCFATAQRIFLRQLVILGWGLRGQRTGCRIVSMLEHDQNSGEFR